MNKSRKKIAIIDFIMLVVLAIVLGITMVWSRDIELKLGLLYYVDADGVAEEDIVTLNGIYASAYDSSELKVHFLDVGQGDCAIIELPDGKTMLIDGGERFSTQKTAIQAFIDKTLPSDFKYFDYAILTHADSDHCGSLGYVLDKYPARVCYRPNVEAKATGYTDQGKNNLKSGAFTKDSGSYVSAIKSMYKEIDGQPNVVYVTDPKDESQTIIGGTEDNTYSFTFYTPLSDNYGSQSSVSWNDYSPVMILEYQGYKFVMSGDAEVKNLGEFVAKVNSAKTDGITDKYDVFDDNYCVNVIKAGHHGSENATTLDYLNVLTTPSGSENVYCVISCGADNKYNHPHDAAIERYKTIGLPEENILRTDQKGDISFTVRTDEAGRYSMYYGDLKSDNPITPDKPDDNNNNNPDDDKKPDKPNDDDHEDGKIQVLVYRELGGIKLKWAVVAWSCYAVIVVAAIIHLVFFANESPSAAGKKGGSGSGKKSSGTGKKGGGRKR